MSFSACDGSAGQLQLAMQSWIAPSDPYTFQVCQATVQKASCASNGAGKPHQTQLQPPQKTPHHTSICRMNCSPACGPKPAMAWINWRPPALLSKVSPATALIVSCRGQLTSSRNVQSMQKKNLLHENLMATKEIHLRTQRLSTCALFWKFWRFFFHFRWNNPRLMRFVAKRYHASSLQRSSKRKKNNQTSTWREIIPGLLSG